jgi:hypothetical protein
MQENDMTLYLVVARGDTDQNLDLFVNADSPREARQFWLKYYIEDDEEDGFDGLRVGDPARVFEVPVGQTTPGAIAWNQKLVPTHVVFDKPMFAFIKQQAAEGLRLDDVAHDLGLNRLGADQGETLVCGIVEGKCVETDEVTVSWLPD